MDLLGAQGNTTPSVFGVNTGHGVIEWLIELQQRLSRAGSDN